MLSFECDYNNGAHPMVPKALLGANHTKNPVAGRSLVRFEVWEHRPDGKTVVRFATFGATTKEELDLPKKIAVKNQRLSGKMQTTVFS